jgi:hypothetical protein
MDGILPKRKEMRKMLPIITIEKYDIELNKLTDIISDGIETFNYVNRVLMWLDELEQLAMGHGGRVAADIAITRGKVTSYVPSSEELQTVTRGQKQKLHSRYIILCLEELKNQLDEYTASSRRLIEETEVLCYKLAAVAIQKGYVKDNQENIMEMVTLIKQDSELMPAWINVIGTVGINNALILFARAVGAVNTP